MRDMLHSFLRRVPIWLVYIVGLLPAPVLLYQAQTGALSVEPIKALEHELGELALQFMIAGLAITPLCRHLRVNLMRFRRSIGVLTFVYVMLHLLVWLVLDVQVLSQIGADIVKRPYITVGMLAAVLMLPLAVTSNNWSVRKMGAQWRVLHRLVYGAALLGGLHYVMLAKGLQLEPLIYMAAIILLLVLRLPMLTRRKSPRSSANTPRVSV